MSSQTYDLFLFFRHVGRPGKVPQDRWRIRKGGARTRRALKPKPRCSASSIPFLCDIVVITPLFKQLPKTKIIGIMKFITTTVTLMKFIPRWWQISASLIPPKYTSHVADRPGPHAVPGSRAGHATAAGVLTVEHLAEVDVVEWLPHVVIPQVDRVRPVHEVLLSLLQLREGKGEAICNFTVSPNNL